MHMRSAHEASSYTTIYLERSLFVCSGYTPGFEGRAFTGGPGPRGCIMCSCSCMCYAWCYVLLRAAAGVLRCGRVWPRVLLAAGCAGFPIPHTDTGSPRKGECGGTSIAPSSQLTRNVYNAERKSPVLLKVLLRRRVTSGWWTGKVLLQSTAASSNCQFELPVLAWPAAPPPATSNKARKPEVPMSRRPVRGTQNKQQNTHAQCGTQRVDHAHNTQPGSQGPPGPEAKSTSLCGVAFDQR